MGDVVELGTSGRWQVTTASSLYVLDLDERWVVRVPDAGAGTSIAPSAVITAMRRDHVRLPLLAVVGGGRLGQSLLMVVDVVGDGQTSTLRQTTEVRQIRRLS